MSELAIEKLGGRVQIVRKMRKDGEKGGNKSSLARSDGSPR